MVLSENQAEALLDGILLTGNYAVRDYALFSTFLFTGVRVSELTKLTTATWTSTTTCCTCGTGRAAKTG